MYQSCRQTRGAWHESSISFVWVFGSLSRSACFLSWSKLEVAKLSHSFRCLFRSGRCKLGFVLGRGWTVPSVWLYAVLYVCRDSFVPSYWRRYCQCDGRTQCRQWLRVLSKQRSVGPFFCLGPDSLLHRVATAYPLSTETVSNLQSSQRSGLGRITFREIKPWYSCSCHVCLQWFSVPRSYCLPLPSKRLTGLILSSSSRSKGLCGWQHALRGIRSFSLRVGCRMSWEIFMCDFVMSVDTTIAFPLSHTHQLLISCVYDSYCLPFA